MFQWVAYNECPIPATQTDGGSQGSFGQCFRAFYGMDDSRAKSITAVAGSSFAAVNNNGQMSFTFDVTKQNAKIQLVPSFTTIMPEKNTINEGYYDFKNNLTKFTLR